MTFDDAWHLDWRTLSLPKKLLLVTAFSLLTTVLWMVVHTQAASAYTISGAVVYNDGSYTGGAVFPSSCVVMTINGSGYGNPAGASGFSGNPSISTFTRGSFTCWGQTYNLVASEYCIDTTFNSASCPASSQPHRSGVDPRGPAAPSSQLDFRWFFSGPAPFPPPPPPPPPATYGLQGINVYNGTSWLPSGCATISGSGSSGGFGSTNSNSWYLGAGFTGNPSVSAPSAPPPSSCGGTTYTLQSSSNPGPGGDTRSSTFCYNYSVDSCSTGLHDDSSGLTTRNPQDPHTQPVGANGYFVDFRWFYTTPKYTVTTTRSYPGGTFPSANTPFLVTGSNSVYSPSSGVTQNSQNNPSSFPNLSGLVQISSSNLFTYTGGDNLVYALVGYTGKNGGTASTLCYNHTVSGCAGPSSAPAANNPRNPTDPTTVPGGPPYSIDVKWNYEQACSSFTVYGLDDTATIDYAAVHGGWTPYQGPPPGGGYPSRDHVAIHVNSSMSGGYNSGCGGYYLDQSSVQTGFPSGIDTHSCNAGAPSCPLETILYLPPSNAGNVNMGPPSTIPPSGGKPLLTFIGTSIEQGTSGQRVNNGRNFPDQGQVTGTLDYRLIYHYVDCSDPAAAVYCPVPPPSLSCTVQSTPTAPDPSNPFTMLVTLINSGGGPLTGASSTVTMPPGGSWAGPNGNVPAGGSTNVNIAGVSRPLGSYPVTLAVNGGNTPGGSQSLPCGSVSVANRPYLHAYGGDVRAGDSFTVAKVCTASPVATIKAFNQGTGNYNGSGSQLGVFATGSVTEFISASISPAAATAHPPKGLTFANTGGSYGGSSGAGICVPDFSANVNGTDDGNRNLATMSGTYHITGGTTLNLGAVPNGRRLTVYVTGNVVLSGASLNFSGNYASPADIPAVYIVASGNIYIDHSVSQLDGVFIAQQGKIFTCTSGGTLYDTTGLAANCITTPLHVNGALIAQEVKLLRMFNTVGNANNALAPYANGTAAEVFDFSPEFWLAVPLDNGGPSGASDTYDSISNLPPVL